MLFLAPRMACEHRREDLVAVEQRLEAVAVDDRRPQQHAHRPLELRVVQRVVALDVLLDLLFAGGEVQHQRPWPARWRGRATGRFERGCLRCFHWGSAKRERGMCSTGPTRPACDGCHVSLRARAAWGGSPGTGRLSIAAACAARPSCLTRHAYRAFLPSPSLLPPLRRPSPPCLPVSISRSRKPSTTCTAPAWCWPARARARRASSRTRSRG